MNSFYKNVQNEAEYIEEIISENTNNSPENAVYEEERENFVINGEELDRRSKLIREIDKIRLHFTFMGESQLFSFEKYSLIRDVISQLSDEVNNVSYNENVLRGIVVLLDLELGIDVSYTTDFISLYSRDLLKPFEEIKGYSFETISNYLLGKSLDNERIINSSKSYILDSDSIDSIVFKSEKDEKIKMKKVIDDFLTEKRLKVKKDTFIIKDDNFDYPPIDTSVSRYNLEDEIAKKDEQLEGFLRKKNSR